jgi:insulysin
MRLFLFLTIFCSSLLATDISSTFDYVQDKSTMTILNPTLANRKTAKIRLKNGLEAYIVSDPETDQSGASLAVEAGSWADPQEYPGMAHFCEHMLFMGTKAYPKEAEYMQFIQDHGGSYNAFTASDKTVYMFSVNNDAFSDVLSRFAQFFIDPLFNSSSVERELLAVDQEHSKNIENDGWREYMILKETGNPAHPNAGFSTGNAQTLGGIPRDALVKWYEKNYSASRMHLVVISTLPLDELVQTVAGDFSSVPNRNTPLTPYPFDLLSAQQEGHFIYIKPIKDIKTLSLVWQPPKQFADDRDGAVFDLVNYALNSGDSESLSKELKREHLADSVFATSDMFSQDETLFQISISLTEKGVKNLNTVIERCFQALSRLKTDGIPEYIFQEVKQMSRINYEYQTREECFSFVQNLGSAITYEPLETFPQKLSIPTTYDPLFIKDFIDTLIPETCVFFVQANPDLTGVKMTSKEKWMGAEYTIAAIPQEQLTEWKDIQVHPHIRIPPRNPFIPKNLTLLPQSSDADAPPTLLIKNDDATIYFKQDSTYKVPTAVSIFSLKTPLLDGSPRSSTLFDLYLYSLTEQLESPLSFASSAGLNFRAVQQDLKIILMTSGYSDKEPIFLKTIFQALPNVRPTQQQFDVYKEVLSKNYHNASQELPFRQGLEIFQNILSNSAPTNLSKYMALNQITYEEFIQFCKTAFKRAYVEGLVYGNCSTLTAKRLWDELKTSLGSLPYPPHAQIKKEVIVLPETGGPFLISTSTERQGNGMLLAVQQGPFTLEKRAAQQVLSSFLSRQFFDTLRTKQQTGYIVQAGDLDIEEQLFQRFIIQSSSYTPQELLARSELFLSDVTHTLNEELPSESFETIRDNLVTILETPPENQEAMALRLNQLAFKYTGDFDWINKRIASLKALSYDSTLKYAGEFFSPTNTRRLAVLVEGTTASSQKDETPSVNPLQFHSVSPTALRDMSTYVPAKQKD